MARLLARPGHAAAIGPCVIEIDGGMIRRIRPAAPDDGAPLPVLAMPALADAHDHGRGLRSLAIGAADAPLELWISRLGAEPVVDPYLRAGAAFARLAESGVCAVNHCHNTQDGRALLEEARGVARAASAVGIRVGFAVPFAGRNPLVYGDERALLTALGPRAQAEAAARRGRTLEEGLALVERIAELEGPCFSVQYGPVGPQWVEDGALRAIARASAETGRRVHMHLFETQTQRDWADARYEGGLVAHLDRIGLLSDRLTLAHAVWLRPDEAELLAERGVTISLNPSSNLRLRSGLAPAALFHRAGLGFGIGLDGMSLDDDDDMLREVRLLRHLANAAQPGSHEEAIPVPALLDAAFVTGRRSIVGDDGGGRLQAGAPCDLMLLDLPALAGDVLDPDPDLIPLLLGRASRRHVRGMMVAGRMVVADGACTGVDRPAIEQALLSQARDVAARVARDPAWQQAREEGIRRFYAYNHHLLPDPDPEEAKKHHRRDDRR
ncbi:amidohydrolase family protein [Acetobacteraceae bacterium KSS8]|uniref:Amidohydrolase family protein n=1 Tax=Endosaccharibacter trunci TaxID=2812733 RepID=A0ABT1WB35_9PROT|nr:amidohydrolase family protein [Acetobacteraceae bacterium KSS8]